MLTPYLQRMKDLFGFENKSEEEKKTLEEEMVKRLLRETTAFLEANLEDKMVGEFDKELDAASVSADAEKELTTLTRYLMKVPDVKYKLDQWMETILSDISYQAINLTKQN